MVDSDNTYYHILDLDESSDKSEDEMACSLIRKGKLTKLPACDSCYARLSMAHKQLYKKKKGSERIPPGNPSSDTECLRDSSFEKAISMLKPLSFKRCDLGRLPKSMPKLGYCGRTAIAPLVAFTIIRQLRTSKHLPDSSQFSTSGAKFSIPTEAVNGKEFVVPLSHENFINSFKTKLPRDDVAARHRLLFLGNANNWNSMETRLNSQIRGQSFNISDCHMYLKLIRKTKALSSRFRVRSSNSLGMLARKIAMDFSRVSRTTDSSFGVVVEESNIAKGISDACSDDVAAARQIIDSQGVKSPAPGVTSSLFWNNSCNDGKLPLLKAVLGTLPGKHKPNHDTLLLKIKRELPNEFENFTEITTHTFPDLFPIPLKEINSNPLKLTKVNIRRHLLDFYDGRFCDKMFIFWMFGILTRHKSVYETCTFFRRNTEIRKK